jgi:hypothetical protein
METKITETKKKKEVKYDEEGREIIAENVNFTIEASINIIEE